MQVGAAHLTQPVMQFCHWWVRELQACVPGLNAGRKARHSRALIVQVLPNAVRMSHLSKGRQTQIGDVMIDRSDSPSAAKQVGQLLRAAHARGATVVIGLSPEDVLQRRINLPLATQENLREVLAFEMERYTTFKAEDVYYSYRLASMNQIEKRIAIDLAVVPRVTADKAIDLVKNCGLVPAMVTVIGSDMTIDETVNFLPSPTASRSRRSVHRLIGALALISASLTGAALYLSYLEQEHRLTVYQEAVEQRRAASLRVDLLRQRVSQLLERSRYVAERKQAQPLLIETVDEITKLLPDSTWVMQFRLQHGQVMLSGYSSAASNLIEALEASPLLSRVAFASPVTFDPKQGTERFNLTAQIEPGKTP